MNIIADKQTTSSHLKNIRQAISFLAAMFSAPFLSDLPMSSIQSTLDLRTSCRQTTGPQTPSDSLRIEGWGFLSRPCVSVNKAGKQCKNFPGIWSKFLSKVLILCTFFHTFLYEKDRNIHRNDRILLKIAMISLQKTTFPRIPKSHNYSMHVCKAVHVAGSPAGIAEKSIDFDLEELLPVAFQSLGWSSSTLAIFLWYRATLLIASVWEQPKRWATAQLHIILWLSRLEKVGNLGTMFQGNFALFPALVIVMAKGLLITWASDMISKGYRCMPVSKFCLFKFIGWFLMFALLK